MRLRLGSKGPIPILEQEHMQLLLSLLHEILTIGDILKKRRQKVRSDSLSPKASEVTSGRLRLLELEFLVKG